MEQNIEDFVLICLDPSCQLFIHIKQFQNLINCIETFNDLDSCIDYITGIKYEKIFFIISFNQMEIIPLIHHISQINSIYIMCLKDQEKTESDLSQYQKVQGQFKTIDELYQQIENDKKYLSKSLIKMNTLSTSSTILNDEIGENKKYVQETTFMYSKVLRDIFIKHSYTENDKFQMIEYIREQYKENKTELQKIENFQREYVSEKAIYWYTIDGFLYRMINKALRTQENFYVQLAGLMLFIYDYDKAEFFFKKVLNESGFNQDTKNQGSRLFSDVGGAKFFSQTVLKIFGRHS